MAQTPCVLVTRPKNQAKDVIARLRKAGAKVIHIPLIEIADPSDNFRSLDLAISQIEKYDWLIFTSQNAVSKFFRRIKRTVRPELVEGRQSFAAVGPATAAALKKHGIKKVIVPRTSDYNAAGLVDVLKKYDFKGRRVLFPSARKARETLPGWLKKMGAKLSQVEAYQTVMPKEIDIGRLKKLMTGKKIDEIHFYSGSAFKNFKKIFGAAGMKAIQANSVIRRRRG